MCASYERGFTMMPSPMTRRWYLAICAAVMLCGGCQFLGIDRREDISYVTEGERKKVVEPMYSVKVEGTNLYKQWPVRRGLDYGTAPWEKKKNGDQPPATAAIVGPGASEIAAAQAMAAQRGGAKPNAISNSTAKASAAGIKKPSEYGKPEAKTAQEPRANRHAPGDIDNDAAVRVAEEMGAERPPVWQAQANDAASQNAMQTSAGNGATNGYNAAEMAALRPPREDTEFDGVGDRVARAGEDVEAVQASDFEEPATHRRTNEQSRGVASHVAEREPLPWRSAAPEPVEIEAPQRVNVATIGAAAPNPAAGVSPGGGLLLMQPASMGPKAHAVVMAGDASDETAAEAAAAMQPIARKLATAQHMAAPRSSSTNRIAGIADTARGASNFEFHSDREIASVRPPLHGDSGAQRDRIPDVASRPAPNAPVAEDLFPPSDVVADDIPDESAAPRVRANLARHYAESEPAVAFAPQESVARDATADGDGDGDGAMVMASDSSDAVDPASAPRYAAPRRPTVVAGDEDDQALGQDLLNKLEAVKQSLPQ
jgi:hypothetical protein